jgi:hypothetical protein
MAHRLDCAFPEGRAQIFDKAGKAQGIVDIMG